MIETISGLPDNALGFVASGEVAADDYRWALVPAIEEKLRKMERVRMLYVLGDSFKGFTGAAAWQDAVVGLKHLTRFSRIAIVTDVDWLEKSVKAFGFMMPGEVRVFQNKNLHDARAWISEPAPTGNLAFEFFSEHGGVLVLRPRGELDAEDFGRISTEIDPEIDEAGGLQGLMIVADHFPGWDDLGAFTAHLRFVRKHQHKVKRIAFVSNDQVLSAMPAVAKHFLAPEMKHFPMGKESEAFAWVRQI